MPAAQAPAITRAFRYTPPVPNTYTQLYTHFIFSTKHREPMLTDAIRPRVFAYMHGICRNMDCRLVIAGGIADHVHLFVVRHPTVSEAELMRVVKANSSKWIHETFPDESAFAWQDGYGAFSVSHSAVDDVRRYIEGQAEHHRTVSFKDELVRFFAKHDIAVYPERVWD